MADSPSTVAMDPNDSDASNEGSRPMTRRQRGIVAKRKLSQSVIPSSAALSDEDETKEEPVSSDGSASEWEPSDDGDSSPRAKRRAAAADEEWIDSPKSSGRPSAKPLAKTTPAKTTPAKTTPAKTTPAKTTPAVKTNNSTSSTKPTEANKGSYRPTPPAPRPETQPPVGLSEEPVNVGMTVLTRRKIGTWYEAKIIDVKETEKGQKYKVEGSMEGNKRTWVSGHHIAFHHSTGLDRLYVGARVVAKYSEDKQTWWYSGTLAELPGRKNGSRFLVFFDDGTPRYVLLPVLHLVCRPLKTGWEVDIEDESYRNNLMDYLKSYPNQPMAMYSIGQMVNVEFNGTQQRCKVESIDGSLLNVLFLDDEHKESVHRGSMRLQHMANMKLQCQNNKS